jgi:hypothetical protein
MGYFHQKVHPRDAKAACSGYIRQRRSFSYKTTSRGAEARNLEGQLKLALKPVFNA